MKRFGLVLVSIVLAVALYRPATSQDNYEGRIAILETRVSVLESASGTSGRAGTLPGRTLYGTVTFSGMVFSQVYLTETTCYGINEYADLAPGSAVVAVDETENVVRSGVLQPGIAPPKRSDGSMQLTPKCSMPFEIAGLTEAEGYRISFGEGRYLDMAWSEMVQANFAVDVTV